MTATTKAAHEDEALVGGIVAEIWWISRRQNTELGDQ